jgi:hypothetical protein
MAVIAAKPLIIRAKIANKTSKTISNADTTFTSLFSYKMFPVSDHALNLSILCKFDGYQYVIATATTIGSVLERLFKLMHYALI